MLGPNHHAHQLATRMHDERLSHSARIRLVARERHDEQRAINLEGHRRLTAARLAATVGGALLAFALAATAVASNPAVGAGGPILIR